MNGNHMDLTEGVPAAGSNNSITFNLPEKMTRSLSTNNLVLNFAEEKDVWSLSKITLKIGDEKAMAEDKNKKGVNGIKAQAGNPFQCKAEQKIELTGDFNATIEMENLKVQPFMDKNSNNDFGPKAEVCEADHSTNNIVPIAVGAALAALVILVLVMYLIGRRKHQRGYQTV